MEGLIENIKEVARDKIMTSIGSMQDILHPVHLTVSESPLFHPLTGVGEQNTYALLTCSG